MQTFIQTDKYLYMPGQLVQFSPILTITGMRALVSYEDIPETWIKSPSGRRLTQWKNTPNPVGLLQLDFQLAEEVEEGTYQIFVRTEETRASQSFKVEEYVLPRFSLTIQPPPYVLATDTEVVFSVCAKYTFGQPVKGTLTLSLTRPYYYYYYYYYYNQPTFVYVEKTLSGCDEVSVATVNIGYVGYQIEVKGSFVEEGTGNVANATASVEVHYASSILETITPEENVKPGLPYNFRVFSRSQIMYKPAKMSTTWTPKTSQLSESDPLEPLQPLNDSSLIRGYFNIDIPLGPLTSPHLKVLMWYARSDGEVVSTSGSADVSKCLRNPTSLRWETKTDALPSPKDDVSLILSSAPSSVCGLDDSALTWSVESYPGTVNGSDKIYISASADLLGPTLENLGNLIRMPYGCGEQNMLNFAPNIYVMQYLALSGQLTPSVEDQLLNYMKIGLPARATLQHYDGSFSAFGNSDASGSTWLTAFVLKSFSQADSYITVGSRPIMSGVLQGSVLGPP
ncbi:LOW QUALITY PROTEIN: pregnancy zone protein-like [Macrobrachium nipponense]|uniref:LOW QUALITY PROTEIN: pregnancy zone protein-like n=1 Tax=Macrobrachium nipponense TaxID=159736 RepID=UPI0030C89DF8